MWSNILVRAQGAVNQAARKGALRMGMGDPAGGPRSVRIVLEMFVA
jgi:hypothetical protein